MLHLNPLRTLHLQTPTQADRPCHVSAASGLVRVGSHFYVVADDEQSLAVFPAEGNAPGEWIRLLPGELPLPKSARKKRKPDFEVLIRLPAFGAYPFGALWALGSGSKPQRQSGVLLPLDAAGGVRAEPRMVDLAPLYAPLAAALGDFNIEGALVDGDRLLLLQRGNKRSKRNASIEFSLGAVLHALSAGNSVDGVAPLRIRDFDLGEVNGVPLCFSDGAALGQGGWLFTAIAEDTESSYADGRCVGATIGRVNARGGLEWMQPLAQAHKVEGLETAPEGDRVRLWLVTDADDAAIPASLYTVVLPISA